MKRLVAYFCSMLLLQPVLGAGRRWLRPRLPPRKPRPSAKLPPEQLDSLVAPIALYPESAARANARRLDLSARDRAAPSVGSPSTRTSRTRRSRMPSAKQTVGPEHSVQWLRSPEAVKRLHDDVQWTTELGNAFLVQQADVMDAVQRMRAKAKGKRCAGVE